MAGQLSESIPAVSTVAVESLPAATATTVDSEDAAAGQLSDSVPDVSTEPLMLSVDAEPFGSHTDFSNVIYVPYESLVNLFSRTNQVSVDENGNLLIPSSMLIDEYIVTRDSVANADAPPDIPLQTSEGSSNSSSTTSTVTEALQRLRHLEKECQTFHCEKKNLRKKLRNSGQLYIRNDGSLTQPKSLGHLCSYRKQCMASLTHDHSLTVFGNYQTSISKMLFCLGKFRPQGLRAVMLMQQSHAGSSHFCSMSRIIVVNRLEFANRHSYQFSVCRTLEVASIT